MPINLTILGSGSAVPTLNRGVSAQYLNINERHILIDCGEGTQIQLRKFKVKFQRLQYVFISHLHGDHFLGIFGLISSMSLLGRTKKLTIFGPEGLEEIVRHQFKISQVFLSFPLDFITISCEGKEKIVEDKCIEVYAFPLKHRVKCHGFLFQEKLREKRIDKEKIAQYKLSLVEILAAKRGQDIERESGTILNEAVTLPPEKPVSYAYCSDTRYVADLPGWIQGVSLLYHEATFTKEHTDRAKATGHSTAEDAATVAKEAEAERLILGHFSSRYTNVTPILDEAATVFEPVTCVADGDIYLVNH